MNISTNMKLYLRPSIVPYLFSGIVSSLLILLLIPLVSALLSPFPLRTDIMKDAFVMIPFPLSAFLLAWLTTSYTYAEGRAQVRCFHITKSVPVSSVARVKTQRGRFHSFFGTEDVLFFDREGKLIMDWRMLSGQSTVMKRVKLLSILLSSQKNS
ncbi:MAG: hypothetical protein QXP70_05345 [Methanomassiliicoccales archaeon]